MRLARRTVALLAVGGVGWLLVLIAIVGGFNKTVTKTVESPPVTITRTHTRTVAITVPSPAAGATTSPATTTAAGTTETASLAVLTAGGKVDPVIDIGRVFEFYLYSPSETSLFVKYRPAGGAPCAATADSDSGIDFVDGVNVVNGQSHYRTAQTWQYPGRYLFCMWLGSSSDDASSSVFQTTVTFRQPTGDVEFRASSSYAVVNRPVTLTFSGRSEASRTLLVKYRSAGGAGCAPTEGSDSGNELVSDSVNGGFDEKVVWTPYSPGSYIFCVWIATDSGDTSPVALRHFYLTVHG